MRPNKVAPPKKSFGEHMLIQKITLLNSLMIINLYVLRKKQTNMKSNEVGKQPKLNTSLWIFKKTYFLVCPLD